MERRGEHDEEGKEEVAVYYVQHNGTHGKTQNTRNNRKRTFCASAGYVFVAVQATSSDCSPA